MASRICFGFQTRRLNARAACCPGPSPCAAASIGDSADACRYALLSRIIAMDGLQAPAAFDEPIRQDNRAVRDGWDARPCDRNRSACRRCRARSDTARSGSRITRAVSGFAGSVIQLASASRGCRRVSGSSGVSVRQQNAKRPHADAVALVQVIAAREHMDSVSFGRLVRDRMDRRGSGAAFSPAASSIFSCNCSRLSAASGMPRSFCICGLASALISASIGSALVFQAAASSGVARGTSVLVNRGEKAPASGSSPSAGWDRTYGRGSGRTRASPPGSPAPTMLVISVRTSLRLLATSWLPAFLRSGPRRLKPAATSSRHSVELNLVAGDLLDARTDRTACRSERSGSRSRDIARRPCGACRIRSLPFRRSGRRRASAAPTARRIAGCRAADPLASA